MERICRTFEARIVIHVEAAPEPVDVDAKVRVPGLSAIAEFVGEEPNVTRGGPKRTKIAERREDIPPDRLPPLWRDALGDLLAAYNRLCAYTSLYIERVTGAPTVDHMMAKSQAWDSVYEWLNYRLACSLMNSRKGAISEVLDPFEVQNGWFEMELVGFQVRPGVGLTEALRAHVQLTIDKLGLNDWDCRHARETYATDYLDGHISLAYLSRRAPFVANELRRQQSLREGDAQ